jgi:predicted nucleic acid-binding protein
VAKTRTFVDAGVLIAAASGEHALSEQALAILDDPDRIYVSSDFVRLEVLPKSVYHGRRREAEFYRTFFNAARRIVKSSSTLVRAAEQVASTAGLSAIDALHIAAALRAKCDEIVTTEKESKPLFRVRQIRVSTISGLKS